MGKEQSFFSVMIVNIMLAAIWHFCSYIFCISVDTKFFDPEKKIYRPKKWERGGRFYSDVLKIGKWKDILPQHIGKDGFSKDHLDDVSVEYLNEFIMETCRAEWNHTINCILFVLLIIINELLTAICLSILLLIGNLPFVVIQRYNRFRLQKLRRTVIRKETTAIEQQVGN